MKYYLDIPIDQWEAYLKYIIEGIYNIKDYTVTENRSGIRHVEFETDPQIPLINSLPQTIIRSEVIVHHSNEKLVATIGEKIQAALADYVHPIGTYYPIVNKVLLAPEELEPIIRQLAREHKINKFVSLSHGRFVIHTFPYNMTVIVKVVDNTLTVTIQARNNSTFDVDDGYTDILTDLNPTWIKWKEADDITAPIHPPNYV